MPVYKYKGQDLSSRICTGTLTAATKDEAIERLRADGKFVASIVETESEESRYRLKESELSEFSREIATMLAAGITVVKTIGIMEQRRVNKRVAPIYAGLYRSIRQGLSLTEAMQEQGDCFPEFIINMFRSGEVSGNLDQVAAQMADYYDKRYRLNTKIRSATTYPKILLGLTLVVMLGMFAFVIPQFVSLFVGMELPWITRAVLAVSDLILNDWIYLAIGVLVSYLIISQIVKIEPVKYELDRLKIRLPLVGALLQVIYTSRFARCLSALYSTGIPMIRAVTVATTIVGNSYIEKQLEDVVLKIKQGEMLSFALEPVIGFDRKLCSTIQVGEESGRLDYTLVNLADSFDFEADKAIDKMISYIEPALIVVMAVFVCIILLSVMLPIFTMYASIQ